MTMSEAARRAIRRAFGARAEADPRRRLRAELARLSDRDLAELGLFRCDIDRVAREATGG